MIAADRHVRAGDLPPGTAMVTFATTSLSAIKVKPEAKPVSLKGIVYAGAGASEVIKGPNGEWIELVETP